MAAWQDPENFARWLALALVMMVGLIVAFVLFTRLYFMRLLEEEQKLKTTLLEHQQQLLMTSVQVQERERERIAADLHDALISQLNGALLSVHMGQPADYTGSLLQQSIVQARRISHDLSPPLLGESSLYELLEEFVTPLRSALPILLSHSNTATSEQQPDATKLQALRMVQEVVQNALKHAQATSIRLHLHEGTHWLGIQVVDDGVGFDAAQQKRGLGSKNIALRSGLLNGQFRFHSVLGEGTTFSFFTTM